MEKMYSDDCKVTEHEMNNMKNKLISELEKAADNLFEVEKWKEHIMEIKRIDNYIDRRFSKKVLNQHGAFVVDGLLYEVEIISDYEAIVHGPDQYAKEIIEEFRFYSEHISKFYNEKMECIAEYEPVILFPLDIEQIQPSQFYVDQEKKKAVLEFIHNPDDIIIPVAKLNNRFILLDGHTRLSVAIDLGFNTVMGFIAEGGNWAERFANEAIKRGIRTPYDMQVLSHEEYEIKWNQFCNDFFDE